MSNFYVWFKVRKNLKYDKIVFKNFNSKKMDQIFINNLLLVLLFSYYIHNNWIMNIIKIEKKIIIIFKKHVKNKEWTNLVFVFFEEQKHKNKKESSLTLVLPGQGSPSPGYALFNFYHKPALCKFYQ